MRTRAEILKIARDVDNAKTKSFVRSAQEMAKFLLEEEEEREKKERGNAEAGDGG
jgi:hypothetical protein